MSFVHKISTRWSDEDQAWIAEISDLPGCMADGPTREAAIAAAVKAAEIWYEVAKPVEPQPEGA